MKVTIQNLLKMGSLTSAHEGPPEPRIDPGWLLWAVRAVTVVSMAEVCGITYAVFGVLGSREISALPVVVLLAFPYVVSLILLRKNPPLLGGMELAAGTGILNIVVWVRLLVQALGARHEYIGNDLIFIFFVVLALPQVAAIATVFETRRWFLDRPLSLRFIVNCIVAAILYAIVVGAAYFMSSALGFLAESYS